MGAIVIMTTVGTEEQAKEVAREVVSRRQAACVNIVSCVRSVYRWKGRICEDGELLLIIKTDAAEYDGVLATIHELHNYELPEILAFDIRHGDSAFLRWIAQAVDKDADFSDEAEAEEY